MRMSRAAKARAPNFPTNKESNVVKCTDGAP
jgi:hypothetical protein